MSKNGWASWTGLHRSVLAAAAALAVGCAVPAGEIEGEIEDEKTATTEDALIASTYTKTKYPIVLCHGMAGFGTLFGAVDYFHGITTALTSGGAKVYVTSVPAFASTEARGEVLLDQVEDIVARTGVAKVNLIGHSHGGLDARYVAAVRPDLVASVTTVGSPNKGADLADFLRDNVAAGGFTETAIASFADALGTVLGLLGGTSSPQSSLAALDSVTTKGMAVFNAKYPAGVPSTWCGQGASSVKGVRYWSWMGTGVVTNAFDASDYSLGLASVVYGGANDGLVGRCSAHLGTVIRDDYSMNHLDEVNQLFGATALFATSPKEVFRTHANRLKNAGL